MDTLEDLLKKAIILCGGAGLIQWFLNSLQPSKYAATEAAKEEAKIIFNSSLSNLVAANAIGAVLGLWLCFSMGILYYFPEVTATLCDKDNVGWNTRPYNILPSISSTIGDVEVKFQQHMWSFTVLMFVTGRIFCGYLFYKLREGNGQDGTNRVRFVLFEIEQFSLIGLTIIKSTENFFWHRNYFAAFWLASIIGMPVTLRLREARADIYAKRRIIFIIHFSSSLMCALFYYLHNTMCEDYIYSVFSIFEYVLVLSNIFFHLVEIPEFKNVSLVVVRNEGKKQ